MSFNLVDEKKDLKEDVKAETDKALPPLLSPLQEASHQTRWKSVELPTHRIHRCPWNQKS